MVEMVAGGDEGNRWGRCGLKGLVGFGIMWLGMRRGVSGLAGYGLHGL